MKKLILVLATAGAFTAATAQPAAACEPTKPTTCEPVDATVGLVKHATWQLLGDVWP